MIQTIRKLQIVACLAGFILAGCGKISQKQTPSIPFELMAKRERYKILQPAVLDSYGYSNDKCDAILITSLCKTAGGCAAADIFAAESKEEPGRWYRHAEHDCFDTGGSASDISKDMFAGIGTYLVNTGDDAARRRVASYGSSHNWIMGRGPLSRTYLTPPLRWIFSDAMTVATDDWIPIPTNTGYRAHLDVLSILLRATARGHKTTEIELQYLKAQRDRVPNNALFQAAYHRYADGNQDAAVSILMNEKLFPSNSIPTDENYCTDYLWSRDEPHDVEPCSDGHKKDGIDFLFATWVAYGN